MKSEIALRRINLSLRELAVKNKWKRKDTSDHRGRTLTVKEIKRIKKKGYCAERELTKKLRSLGFSSVRVPVSAPSAEPLPDVFAMKGSCLLAFEVKAQSGERTYYPKDQIKKLFDFLRMFEPYETKIAVICAKFPYQWVFKQVEKVDDYVIHKDEKSTIQLDEIK